MSIQFVVPFVCGIVGGVYLAMSPRFGQPLYHYRIFNEWRSKPDESERIRREVNDFYHKHKVTHNIKAADGKNMHAWLFENKFTNELVLYCIGRCSNIANCLDSVEALLASGFSVLIFEYRGFGLSDKQAPTVASICEDGLSAFDFATKSKEEGGLGYTSDQLVVLGESLGGGVASYITQHRSPKGLIIQSGFGSLRRIGRDMMPLLWLYPKQLYPKLSLDNEAVLAEKHPPVLIIHGMKDNVIPHYHARKNHDAARGWKRVVFLPETTHHVLGEADLKIYADALMEFRRALWKGDAA
jgi:alpha-beta hydrolase superfamily lysophospholipase